MNRLAAKITESELEIMRILWNGNGPLTLADIRRELEKSSDWDSSTIKTLLRRLCEKESVTSEKRDVFHYSPKISETEYNEYMTQNIIDRLYNGSARDLVASLVSSNKLDRKDIDELRSMFKVGGRDE